MAHKIIVCTMTFYSLDMYIFSISDRTLGTCSTILKDYGKGRCIIGLLCEDFFFFFCLSMVADITKIMHGPIFCSPGFISVCVLNVWPKTTLLPVWPRDSKRLDSPVRLSTMVAISHR